MLRGNLLRHLVQNSDGSVEWLVSVGCYRHRMGDSEAAGDIVEGSVGLPASVRRGAVGQDGPVSEGVSARPAPHVLGGAGARAARRHRLVHDSAEPSRAFGCCSVQSGETIVPGVVHC
jgi:hypothetical protein